MRNLSLFLFLVLVCIVARADQLPVDPELHYGTLPNGFTYYIRHNATPPGRAHFWLVHKVGSVMEEENERGLAHFLEHMAFTGTKNYSDVLLYNYLTRNGLAFGTDVNATTSYDDTQYYIQNVPSMRQTMLDSVLYIMRDLSCNLLLDSLQIDRERAIIHEERTSNSTSQLRLQERALPMLMSGSRYANRIPIGLPEVVEAATTSQLREFYHHWYRPDRQALIVVGDFDAAQLERKVKRIFGVMPTPVEPSPTIDLTLPDHKGLRTVTFSDPELDGTMVNLYFKHDDLPLSKRNTDVYLKQHMLKTLALYMLSERLERLTRYAQTPLQMVQANDTHFIATRSKEAFVMSAMAKPGQVLSTVEQLLTEARRMTLHGFTETELDQARRAVSANLRQYALQVNQHESADYVTEYIDHYLSGGYIPGVVQEVEMSLSAIERIALNEINQFVRSWVSTDNACLLIAGTDNEAYPAESALQTVFAQILTSSVEPYQFESVASQSLMKTKPLSGTIVETSRDAELKTTTLLLSNGCRVVLRPDKLKVGEVMFDAIASGGQWAMDSTMAPQLKVLEAAIEDSRLGGFSQEQLRTMLADRQLAISFTLGDDYHDLQGGCSTADLETLMQAIHLYFTDVTADHDSYQALMARLRAQVQQSHEKPEMQLADSIAVAHYGHNPVMMTLTEAELDCVNYADLLQLYRQYVARPDQFTFIFVGDFDVDTLADLAQRYIASLPVDKTLSPMMSTHRISLQSGQHEVTVRAPMSNERAQVQVTESGTMHNSMANEVMMVVYGHVVEIVLNAILREQHQLTYGVNASAQLLRNEPRWILQYKYACKPQDVDRSIDILIDAVAMIQDSGVSEQLFDKVKQMMLRHHDEDINTNAYWMNVLRNRAMGHDIHTGIRQILQSLTLDQFDSVITDLSYDTNIQVIYR